MSDTISIVLNGNEYVNFLRVEVHVSFLSICRYFKADVSIPENGLNDYPVQMGQKFIVKVNGEPTVTGYIEKINIHQDAQSRVLKIYGRDILQDLVDSTIDGEILQPFNGSVSFKTVCQTVLDKLGINVSVIDTSENGVIFAKDDYIATDIGESAANYLQKYAEKVQVFLNSDGNGNLQIKRANDSQTVQNYLSMRPNNNQNRILSSDAMYNNSVLFNEYRCHAQQQTLNTFTSQIETAVGFENSIAGVLGVARNSTVRPSRIYNFISSTSLDKKAATNRAIWASNFHSSKYAGYKCTVVGYTYDGSNNWQVNQKVKIDDFYAGVNATLLISSLEFSLSLDQGLITKLCFVPPDSFTLQAERTESSKESQKLGKVYGSDQ